MDEVVLQAGGRRRKNEMVLGRAEKQGKVLPGIVLKGVFLAVAVGLMPLLHKQSPHLLGYANQATIARSWELINLLLIALAISYGFISRRHAPTDNANANANANDIAVAAQGAQNYVQKIFDFAEVFENIEKVEAWSSRWQPQEPLVVIARDGKIGTDDKDKPLLLPLRSLKSSLSNPEVFEFLKDAAVEESGKPPEVRNSTILSVESGKFDEEISSNVIADKGEPAVFPSPIPWSSRLDKEAHPLAPAVVNLASDDGKNEPPAIPSPIQIDPPAIPSPIPWRSRLDRSVSSDHDVKQNGDVSDSKPPLRPPHRPPPEMPKKSVSPSPPRPCSPSVELTSDNSGKILQASSGIPLHKPPSVENGHSQKNPNPKPPQYSNAAAQSEENNSAKEDPTALPAPSVPQNGPSVKHHLNGNLSIPKSTPLPPPVSQEFPQAKEGAGRSGSGSGSRIRESSCDSSKLKWAEAEEGAGASRKSASPQLAPPPRPLSPPLPPPPPYSDEEELSYENTSSQLTYENTSSSSQLLYQMERSISESEEEEVDKKADQFIAKFHEQIRLQRVESMRRSQEES